MPFQIRVMIRLCWLCNFGLGVPSDYADYVISDYGVQSDWLILQFQIRVMIRLCWLCNFRLGLWSYCADFAKNLFRVTIRLCWLCNFRLGLWSYCADFAKKLFRVTIRLCWLCNFRLLVRLDCADYAISDYGYNQIMLQKLQPCAKILTTPAKQKNSTITMQFWSIVKSKCHKLS
jgi:hypothetical protein